MSGEVACPHCGEWVGRHAASKVCIAATATLLRAALAREAELQGLQRKSAEAVTDLLAQLGRERSAHAETKRLLREVVENSAVAHGTKRYYTLQIDRGAWDEAVAAVKEDK